MKDVTCFQLWALCFLLKSLAEAIYYFCFYSYEQGIRVILINWFCNSENVCF